MKTIFQLITTLILFLTTSVPVFADTVTLHLFWSQGCPHCAKEKEFLTTLTSKYPMLTVHEYEITQDKENAELLSQIGKKLGVTIPGVPFTLIGDKEIVGYFSDETTGKEIEDAVCAAMKNGCHDLVSEMEHTKNPNKQKATKLPSIPESLSLPIIGAVSIKNFSLPVLTFILALLDGFNPCAMWTLLFLISILLGMKDRKRMWILGSAFIVTSASVYFLFLAAWLNLFLFIGFIFWVRIAIGTVALGASFYNIRDYIVNKQGGCKVMGNEKRQKVFIRIRDITQKQHFFLALGGMIILAVMVNMIELVCSAGLPAIYTQILSMSHLPSWQYYLYLAFYVLIFMFDDLLIFFTAMITLRAVGIESKYSRASHLIGGILMGIIGILLIFKPELLMFG